MTYVYCDQESCMRGLAEPEGAYSVTLKGFMTHPATKSLRTQSEETTADPDYDFTEMGAGMSKELHRDRCQSRPCIPIGNLERNVHRFIKIEDF